MHLMIPLFRLATLILAATLWVFSSTVEAAARKPNVILILADDLGYETIGANGGTSYKTPALDKLAQTGARFTHGYAQPLCTPTRVQLMTGKYNIRNYIQFAHIDPKSVTFGNLFKEAGYATAVAGKWQLGQDPQLPRKLGFDESYLWQHTRRPPRYANPGLEINGVEKDFNNGEYGPDLVSQYAVDFIERKRNEPFFLYYPMMLTHAPYQPTPDSKTWDATAKGETVNERSEHFRDMVQYMDKLVGKLIAKLDELKLRENTLVIFMGDNGTGAGTRSKMGSREVIGGKGRTTAAGMHVPLIVNWTGKIVPGKVHTTLADSTDILPTICEAAGINVLSTLKLDGRSFLPQLKGEPGKPREWIYSWYWPRSENGGAPRECAFNHNYKLYADGKFYDSTKDREEKTPLEIASLKGDAAAAAKMLRKALDEFKDARPEGLSPDVTTAKARRKNNRNKE